MRRVLIALTAGGALFVSGASAAARRPTCRRPPSEALLVQTHAIRVFNLADGTYYACARRRGARPLVLATEFEYTHETDQVGLVDAKGAFVALEEYFGDYAADERTVNVWDVVRRKQLWRIPTGVADPTRCPYYYGTGELSDLVLKRDGAVAWITQEHPCSKAPGSEVHRADHRGTTLLMTDPAVKEGSLALRGNTLSWGVGKAVQTAELD